MVKLRYILVMVLMATASTPVFAGWKVVIDKNCIKVVAANTCLLYTSPSPRDTR